MQSTLASGVSYYDSFDKTYKNAKTKNIKLNVDKFYKSKPDGNNVVHVDDVGAHSVDYEHPEVIKENIDNGKIPTIKPKTP